MQVLVFFLSDKLRKMSQVVLVHVKLDIRYNFFIKMTVKYQNKLPIDSRPWKFLRVMWMWCLGSWFSDGTQ